MRQRRFTYNDWIHARVGDVVYVTVLEHVTSGNPERVRCVVTRGLHDVHRGMLTYRAFEVRRFDSNQHYYDVDAAGQVVLHHWRDFPFPR